MVTRLILYLDSVSWYSLVRAQRGCGVPHEGGYCELPGVRIVAQLVFLKPLTLF